MFFSAFESALSYPASVVNKSTSLEITVDSPMENIQLPGNANVKVPKSSIEKPTNVDIKVKE